MPVIPKGDNFGNAQIRAGRTNLQGDNGAVGRAMAGLGREVMGVGLKIQHEKEQKRKSLNRVSMANGAMEYQQQVNEVLKNVNEQVNSGQLPPEKARQKTQELISNIDTQAFMPNNLDDEESAVWGLNINKINNGADLEATGVEEKGVKLKAQTDINKLITNAKANNYNPEQVQQMLNSEDVKKTGTLVWGLASQENLKSLGRSYTTDYLQNEITIAADKGDYKALKKIKSDIQNQEYHKDWVLSDDRVRLTHNADTGLDQIEAKQKRLQAEYRQVANDQRKAVLNSLYNQLDDGVPFDQLDQSLLTGIKMNNFSDYASLKGYNPVKRDDTTIYSQALNDINNGKDINLTDKQYRANLTPSSIKSLTVKQQTLKADAKEQQDLFSSNQLFNTQAKVFGVRTGTEDFMRLQNETNEAIRLESEKQGRKLTNQEKERIINNQFVTGTIKNSGYFWDDKKMLFQVDKKDRANFVVEKESNIPDPIKKELTKRLEARGVKPTPELLLGAYNAYLKGNN